MIYIAEAIPAPELAEGERAFLRVRPITEREMFVLTLGDVCSCPSLVEWLKRDYGLHLKSWATSPRLRRGDVVVLADRREQPVNWLMAVYT